MYRPTAWRLLAGPAAVIVAALVATPAFAAVDAKIDISLPDTVVVGVGAETKVSPVLKADHEVTLTGASITYTLEGELAGVGLADPEDGHCEGSTPTKLVCSVPYEIGFGPDGAIGYLEAGLKAADTAKAGATGKVTATFAADGVAPISTTAVVEVATGVDLVAGRPRVLSVKPGAAFTAELEVTNRSGEAVHGAAVAGIPDYAFEATTRFANCDYQGQGVSCFFEQDLEAGATYTVNLPYQLRKATMAPSTSAGEFQWLTADEFGKRAKTLAAAPGQGGELTLTKVADARSLAEQTDTDPDNNWQIIEVKATGIQGADIEALGDEVSGAAGATVTVEAGVRNNGPATVDRSRSGEAATVAVVTVPTGTKVTTVPTGCQLITDGSKKYLCVTSALFKAGETVTWKFGLHIDKVVANATGLVEANPACRCSYFAEDIKKSNDKAKLVVNPAGGASGGDSDSGDSDDSGDDADEPSLPITGPAGGPIAGVGALLVAAGAAILLFTRKRRGDAGA
jgi:hypothetical protein